MVASSTAAAGVAAVDIVAVAAVGIVAAETAGQCFVHRTVVVLLLSSTVVDLHCLCPLAQLQAA